MSRAGFENQFASYAASKGADAADFQAWARQHAADEAEQAMLAHVQRRNVGAYDALLGRYMENLDLRNPDAILNANFPDAAVKANRGADGRIVLDINGRKIGWPQAVRLGLVGPRRG